MKYRWDQETQKLVECKPGDIKPLNLVPLPEVKDGMKQYRFTKDWAHKELMNRIEESKAQPQKARRS